MKNLITTLFLLLACLSAATAQYVTIPDANFRSLLQQGYPACFNTQGQMDTTCTAIVTETFMNCTNRVLVSLDGMQYFDGLQNLNCTDNQLTSLPTLPSTLQSLSCQNNQLISLPGIPTTLQHLECSGNLLASLPALPATLQHLRCNVNQLTSLPTLPASLQFLYCWNNQLTNLPTLPASLQFLYCWNNQLTNLPALPPALQVLYCFNNQLTSLPDLPTTLEFLDCGGNQLTNLPVLPTVLQTLNCYNNQLTSLPVLPDLLRDLRCFNNQLTSLPGLPTTLEYLDCRNNQLICLPFLSISLNQLYCPPTITCLPNIPPNIWSNTLPLCTPSNPNGCLFAARIYGKTYQDLNQNCTVEGTDILQKNLLVQAKNTATQEVYTTNSKADGTYELGLPAPATYEVKTVLYNNNYWSACPPQTVFLQADTAQVQRDMLIQPVVQCADVEVNHQLQNIARPCTTAVYKVSAFNAGTITAVGLTATIRLPNELNFVSSSRSFTPMGNGVYRVTLPNIPALARDTFSFLATVSCAVVMNQMLCTEVEILPNTYCIGGGLVGWDGSDIQLSGRCVGSDSIRFVLRNIGQGGMSAGRNYTVIEDNIMIRGNAFQLAAGASDSVTVAADAHRIYRIIADEAPNNPAGNTQETFMVWGCNGSNGLNWGFVNQFGLNNGTSNPHQLCSQVRTSFDPNDIAGTPEGVGPQHFILKNTDLEYKIRFQNTGNDTAFVVRVLDKLPAELDASTLRIGTASHPFTWRLASNGVLEFLFQNILLPDSTTNQVRSHGFVTYRIKTKPNLTNGTTIHNQAQIYFDVNAPVATNIYTHTIGETYAFFLFSTPQIIDNQYFVKIFPNPIHDAATIEIKTKNGSLQNENLRFTIYNTLGQALQEQAFAGQTLHFTQNNLPNGIYFYSIQQGNEVVARGKLEVN
jgi:uncharacterized repeat protein (TIGR01451 family)